VERLQVYVTATQHAITVDHRSCRRAIHATSIVTALAISKLVAPLSADAQTCAHAPEAPPICAESISGVVVWPDGHRADSYSASSRSAMVSPHPLRALVQALRFASVRFTRVDGRRRLGEFWLESVRANHAAASVRRWGRRADPLLPFAIQLPPTRKLAPCTGAPSSQEVATGRETTSMHLVAEESLRLGRCDKTQITTFSDEDLGGPCATAVENCTC
jgi:hypothetical protein